VSKYLSVKQVLRTDEFAAYYQAAVSFCAFLEERDSIGTLDFLLASQAQLLRLYATALAMPWIELQTNKEYDDKLSDESFQAILLAVAERLGKARYYWHVFDPTNDLDNEPVCGDLLDDFGDIYKNLKYTLLIFHLGQEDCEENALWQFKSDFDAHWGRHCINALMAIHFYVRQF
jgi:hypothetical protein